MLSFSEPRPPGGSAHDPNDERRREIREAHARPLVEELILGENDSDGYTQLQFTLAARNNATGRPDEMLAALGLDPFAARVERIALILAPTIQDDQGE